MDGATVATSNVCSRHATPGAARSVAGWTGAMGATACAAGTMWRGFRQMPKQFSKKALLFRKKEAKNFCPAIARLFGSTPPSVQKFFGSFFQKRTACFKCS
jgi:hypothetical protein